MDLAELLDRAQISECLCRYARGIDRLDDELVRSAFHEDAIDCHGALRTDRAGFLAALRPLQAGREATQHYLANQVIELDGDTAHVETYFWVANKLAGDDQTELMGGRYIDRFERRAGEWRIAVRVVVVDWSLTGDAARMPARLAANHRGVRDRTDVSYERPLAPRDLTPPR